MNDAIWNVDENTLEQGPEFAIGQYALDCGPILR